MKFKKGAYGNIPLSKAIDIDTSLLNESRYLRSLKRYKKKFERRNLRILIMEEEFKNTNCLLEKVRQFVKLRGNLRNPYRKTRINECSQRGTGYYPIRMVAKGLRIIGFEKIVHEVKKSSWSDILRERVSNTVEPIVDKYGIQILHDRLSEQVSGVANLLDRPQIIEAWSR
ncbi:MAG: hypothetical protein ABEI13_04360 [Candidatus Paceibacteria bacterium]